MILRQGKSNNRANKTYVSWTGSIIQINKSSIDLYIAVLLHYQPCLEGLSTVPVTTAIRSAASSPTSLYTHSHSSKKLPVPISSHTINFFYCCLIPIFFPSLLTSVAYPPPFSLSLSLDPPPFFPPPFCGWQSPWDYAHSKLENLELCPNTSFQDLPGEIPHGCLYTPELPSWLPLSSFNSYSLSQIYTPLPPQIPASAVVLV